MILTVHDAMATPRRLAELLRLFIADPHVGLQIGFIPRALLVLFLLPLCRWYLRKRALRLIGVIDERGALLAGFTVSESGLLANFAIAPEAKKLLSVHLCLLKAGLERLSAVDSLLRLHTSRPSLARILRRGGFVQTGSPGLWLCHIMFGPLGFCCASRRCITLRPIIISRPMRCFVVRSRNLANHSRRKSRAIQLPANTPDE